MNVGDGAPPPVNGSSGLLPCDLSGEVHRLMVEHSAVLNAVGAGRPGRDGLTIGLSPEAVAVAGSAENALGFYGITSVCPLFPEVQERVQSLL